MVDSLVMVQSKDFDLEKIKKEKLENRVEEETEDFDVDTSKQENLTK